MATSTEFLRTEPAAWFRHPLMSALLAIFWGSVMILGVVGLSGQTSTSTSVHAAEAAPEAVPEQSAP